MRAATWPNVPATVAAHSGDPGRAGEEVVAAAALADACPVGAEADAACVGAADPHALRLNTSPVRALAANARLPLLRSLTLRAYAHQAKGGGLTASGGVSG
jgi:hypothetical protein